MAKTVELLLTESVENLGIVGDVVKVRTGYARNYLMPRNVATTPSQELIESLKVKRATAQAQVSALRSDRAQTIEKLAGHELAITRACNDQGILYGGVTQQEISEALIAAGFGVRPRDVRLSGAIKRVDTYDIHVKFEAELETNFKLIVKPDRVLAKDEKPDLDFDMEGNLVEKRPGRDRDRGDKHGSDKHGSDKHGSDKHGSDKHASDKHPGDKQPDRKDGAAADAKHGKGDKHDAKHPDAKTDDAKAEKKPTAAEDDAPKKASKKPREDVKKAAPAKKA